MVALQKMPEAPKQAIICDVITASAAVTISLTISHTISHTISSAFLYHDMTRDNTHEIAHDLQLDDNSYLSHCLYLLCLPKRLTLTMQ